MSWVTVIWSVGAGACLTLAVIHIVVWSKDRTQRANLVFSVMAVAVAVFAALELAMMQARTPEQWGIAVRWIHVPAWVIIASLVAFVRLYLRAGRRWLAWAVIGVRTLSLILNFVFSPNINFREITALRHIPFLGEPVSVVAAGVPNPWMLVAQSSLLLLVIFVMDATITVWRRGNRRQALIVGGSILLFTIAGTVEGVTITWGIIAMPLTASLFYLGIVAAMACELGYDVLHARALARQLHASEAGLRESEERFRIVADAAPVLIWMSGMDKLCTFFNKPWLEFTGRSLEQEIGNGWAEGVHPDDLQRCLKIYTEAFDARQPFVMQYRLRRYDGEYRWISDQGVARHGAQGNFAGYIGSCVDVTELLDKERALREFEERVVLAAEAAHLGVWEMDTTTNELWMSEGARSLFQFDSQTPLNHAMLQDRVHPEDRALRDSAMKDAIEARGQYEMEYRVLLPDGTLRWIGARGRCITGESGDGTRLIGVSIDITPRKLAEAEVLQHREDLSHLSRVAVMGELSASIAHELNQPLSGIVSNAAAGQRFIDRGDVDLAELRELLADISADGRRAGDVLRGIQSMVKKGVPARQAVNLNDLVIRVARMVNPNAMLQSCQLETSLEPNLPAIEADPIQLQQVLLNLIINAFDAMAETPASRRKVEIVTERNGSDAIRMSVRDYGVGVPEEARERVFEQFFTTKAKGLGLGLAIVRSIIESHGGIIAAENADGGGARFQFTLPASAAPSAV
jgi:two-component system, LuxR family, sensor kinase FixL